MILPEGVYDLHVHTTFCDGKNTPAETAAEAYRRGIGTLGFSGHSYTSFDTGYCMSREGTAEYRAETKRLRAEYAGKMNILLGIEQDIYSDEPAIGYDYIIGSVHYFKIDGNYYPVDHSAGSLTDTAGRFFGGDIIPLAVLYYETLAEVAEKTKCDIIGHFDLITKFNEGDRLFDTSDPRYVSAWRKAADRLLISGALFEINTGAISRGYRTSPYPSPEIESYLRARGARFIKSSDSHRAETLLFGFSAQ
ncbi:MAG: histidinol-phosphatase [Clostridia bacterium]|nr:histidinol-phosphatase [Clostridia bacterium]